MRTTIDIDDDVLNAAKAMARRENLSAGQVVSRLLRAAMTGRVGGELRRTEAMVAGFHPFASRGRIVTNEQIDALRDEAGI